MSCPRRRTAPARALCRRICGGMSTARMQTASATSTGTMRNMLDVSKQLSHKHTTFHAHALTITLSSTPSLTLSHTSSHPGDGAHCGIESYAWKPSGCTQAERTVGHIFRRLEIDQFSERGEPDGAHGLLRFRHREASFCCANRPVYGSLSCGK